MTVPGQSQPVPYGKMPESGKSDQSSQPNQQNRLDLTESTPTWRRPPPALGQYGIAGRYGSPPVTGRREAPSATTGAIGVSGMMHGYLPLDADGALLTAFRTWRNTITAESSAALSALFGLNIPQRWSVSHLHRAVTGGEEHVARIARITTLAGYVHWHLTGRHVLGVGEASGVFPIGAGGRSFDADMIAACDGAVAAPWSLADILPEVAVAGQEAGRLTESGAALLDPTGALRPGIPLCPPEGDAGTGMVATDSVRPRTGNVSAGTSAFAMIVLEAPLRSLIEEIDLVATPSGAPVAMAHANNCTSDLNAWVEVFSQFAGAFSPGAPSAPSRPGAAGAPRSRRACRPRRWRRTRPGRAGPALRARRSRGSPCAAADPCGGEGRGRR